MTWSIFKDSSVPFEQWQPCRVAWYIDQDSTGHHATRVRFLHDGPVRVYFWRDWVECSVVNGEWAGDTEERILSMTRRRYHGEFIEAFVKENGNIQVIMGS